MPNLSRRKWLRKSSAIYLAILLILVFGGVFVARKVELKRAQNAALDSSQLVPSPIANPSTTSTITSTPKPSETPPAELNLAVPFTSQAPAGNWDRQHEENCEEAVLLMANRYLTGRKIAGSEDAEQGMAEIVAWENENLGVSDSIDAMQTAEVARVFLNLKAEVLTNPDAEQIKQAISDDKLVLVPAAGRELDNPFFKQPGPLYHMLLIRGYTADKFITNDPGTRHGENYVYGYQKILDANHEWNGGDVSAGRHQVIVVSK